MITYFIVPHLDLAGQALVWRVNAAPGVGHILADIGECWNQAIGIVGTDALVSPSMKDKSSLYNSKEKNQKSFISHKTTHNKSEKQKVLARTHSPPPPMYCTNTLRTVTQFPREEKRIAEA